MSSGNSSGRVSPEAQANVERRVPTGNVVLPQPSTAGTDEVGGETSTLAARPVSRWTIALLLAATFGSGMAMIVPMAYSLTVKLDQLAPGRADVLGYILGIGSAATLVLAPLTGVLSDHTRSRWGRRRPFTVIGLIIGAAAIPVMASAPTLPVLAIGWVLSTAGWGTAAGSIANWQADQLPPSQRGSVSGAAGLMMQIAPVIGIIIVGLLGGDVILIFVVPAAIGIVLTVLFIALVRDPDSRQLEQRHKLSVMNVVRSYGFTPRKVPDFSWNWAGRFVFFLGLTLTTSFSVFYVAQRLDLAVDQVAGVLALTSGLSIISATVGAIGSGWISDRIGRRKPLIFAGAALFAGGSVISAFAYGLPLVISGMLVSSLGIAIFSAVGQALVLDVLPERETQAGRYMAITAFSQKIPGVISPIAAPLLLAIGGAQNFVALYLTAALLALAGGALIALKVRGVR